uniref:NADH-ubiquinone oxidoreductase chain 5 n=1 Tax=Chelonus formosanus TaxID=2739011 RepID=A0A8K1PT58_9HYME|nr:NADH dehydrogenase subunit 5 [Chelonus formosanus]UBR43344.1 NADH dehydrogenase subunit 5 [Chelonus formosanus]UDP58207.1 NADH dehydrogenase subunit 5 [Chelonus formosanus]UHY94333.1 NADH dehydrogenase subunit 5 [Chelonus formosanus]UJM44013.1 NADH dehydrogenase subunit 5 [Chelonus formosanus]
MYMFISINLMMLSILFTLMSLYSLIFKFNLIIEWSFLHFFSINFKFIMMFDWMTNLFLMTIFIISSSVLIYSMEYMKYDTNFNRFMNLVLIFILSMILMVICPNMMTILIGWDGLGISSYCLIIFYQNSKSINSGLTTILMNRIGDIFIILIFSMMLNYKNLNFMFIKSELNMMISLMIFMCAITKSAQIPFSSWLPLAMAAPTPVSSLVHSSTLVTAGIYLLIRFNKIMNTNLMMMITYMSIMTLLISSFNAIYEFDLKKIIALSTLSQLALMMFTLSLNLPKLSFFHLISHAMFKSLLFLCSGIMIHNSFNNQDIRLMNMFNFNMNLTKIIFNTASLSLCGFPFLSGFYSKDLIIEMFNMMNTNIYMFIMLYFSMFLTLMYSMRLIYFTSFNSMKSIIFYKNNMNNLMNKSITCLFFLSIMFSSMINWLLYNNLNIIFLTKLNKLLIYFNFIILLPMLYLLLKMKFIKKSSYFLILLMNSLFMLNFLFKYFNKKYFKFNLKYLMNLDLGWQENLILIKILLYSMKLSMKINKIKFMNLIFLTLIMMYLYLN